MIELVFGVVLGAAASWLIAHFYYARASDDQRREIDSLKEELRPRTTLEDFERYLVSESWESAYIDDVQTWRCRADNTFQIRIGERKREFNERWTTFYPDRYSGAAYPVYLFIGNLAIKELTFISMDGGRIFVPMAELAPVTEDRVEYFWNLGSLDVKVCRVIGSYYIYQDLEGVAKMSRVKLVGE